MTNFLPRPGSLARRSRPVAECALCTGSSLSTVSRSRIPSRLPKSYVRRYATVNDDDPKPDKNTKDAQVANRSSKDGEKKIADSASKIPGKPPPGFEETFDKNNRSSPLSAPSGGSEPDKHDTAKPPPGFAPMDEREMQVLDTIAQSVKKGLPQSQTKIIDDAIDMIKRGGVPNELREIMNEKMNNPNFKMDLATAAKLVRVFTKMSRMNVQQIMAHLEKEQNGKKEKDEGEPAFKQSYSQKGKGGQQKGPDPSKIRIGEFKLDTGTFLISAFLSYYLYRSLYPGESSRDITWQEFRTTFLDKGLVDKLTVINRNKVRVELHREAVANMYPESPAVRANFYYYFTIGSVEAFERRLDEAHQELGIPSSERIPVAYIDEVPLSAAFFSFGPTLLFVAALFYFSRRAASGAGGQSGIFGIGKSRAKRFNHETDIKTKFSDVAGMDEAKLEIMEFVSFLKDPTKYQSLGAKIPRGAILSGPPGTGKTLLAKATAGESGVPFYSVSGSEFVEMFVGVGPSRVRDLFSNARKNTPCIIFIDEIDAIGKSRAKQNFGGGNDERESTLNQILTEMDGFNTSEQVVVLAGTNRPDVLDKALMRPGRFDRHISIDRPTMDGRKQIFLVHLKKIVTSVNMDYLTGRLSALTPGFSGADIANCVNEAALIAARANATAVEMTHFEQAIERVIGGLEKKSLVLTPEEKKTVAYHEAGHAICGWFFKYADPLLKVSIIPRGQGALGYAQYLPAGGGDVYLMNVKQLMDRMAMTLGGRVSEELWFDTVTSGASDDFNKVTRMATAMVTEWGMSQKIGYLNYKDDEQRLHKPFSEETARNIDSEVRRIVDEAYKQCKDLLEEKKDQLQAVAEELLKKEMLVRDDLVRILGKRPFEDRGDFHKYFDNQEGKSAPPPPPTEGTEGAGPEIPAPAFRQHDVRG
ncbi:hypothetical protein EPUS_08479 [Endocarpon pusillum Z07020]|uniref:AAA+ ATPase domain-containing protein n=1 Tax=Endocarpon pusillum (strain Z07020 / HMAS-L-300199) TaxID=1263415 RepID=U1GLT4_ENDPU|nr:uncharacterized protein EPUS_08479 [Endocarpon pusillum Z07020]ERF72866.1 hypothetical protein EPUS_08479 [Endocarpon pusillum Z07020]